MDPIHGLEPFTVHVVAHAHNLARAKDHLPRNLAEASWIHWEMAYLPMPEGDDSERWVTDLQLGLRLKSSAA
jgi:hypothetical protein